MIHVPAIRNLTRELGRARGERPGPTLLVVAGIHGNEPAGLFAAERVFPVLRERALELAGEVVVLRGNLRGLRERKRFLDRDLNRRWSIEQVAALRARARDYRFLAEDFEQLELLDAIEGTLAAARGRVHFLDLHTTSAEGIPFAMVGGREDARAFALHFPLPILHGILEALDGVLLEYMTQRGCISVGVEGGQNLSERSIRHHEAVLWIAIAGAGLLPEDAIPGLDEHRALLREVRARLPHVMQIVHRQAITPEDEFRMEPGFQNIQTITRGQLLARDRRGEIRAPDDGLLLLPLYQGLGDDGFFLGRALNEA
jgi:succinylglutamate desuccinylase